MENTDDDPQLFGKLDAMHGQQGVSKGMSSSTIKQDADSFAQAIQIDPRTIDGLFAEVPTRSLEESLPGKHGDGGFDVYWPTDGLGSDEVVARDVAGCLSTKGYCVVQESEKSEKNDMIESLQQEICWYKSDFVSPPHEFEVEYLGQQPESKIAWLQGDTAALMNEAGSGIGHCMKRVSRIGSLLIAHAANVLRISPACEVGKFMLRQNFEDICESRALSCGPLTEEQKHDGAVSSFLDFVQRRKICCMYFVTCEGGTVELISKQADSGRESVTLPALGGKLLLLQQDRLDYAFKPSGAHIVMQGWVLSEPRSVSISELVGTEEKIGDAIGAKSEFNQPMSRGDDIHIIAASIMVGGNVRGTSDARCMYECLCDCFVEVPYQRWDHSLYYTPDEHGTGALCRHFGAVNDDMLFSFDHNYFGLTYEEANSLVPSCWMEIEGVMEVLMHAGYTLETVRNKRIDLYLANGAKLCELLDKNVKSTSNERWRNYYTGCDLIAHLLGLNGQIKYIDTACSSSNVATQLAYQEMRIRRDARKYHGYHGDEFKMDSIIQGSMFNNDAIAFIGLSQSHMLGRVGRCMTYDNSASGFAKGEGCGCVYLQNDASVEGGLKRMVDIIGGFINQDGRSASLTAPSGPSQSLVVNGGLRDAGRAANTTSLTEMHGTGTALGDPVETGSVKNALNKNRYNPLVYGAGKSQTGHLEMGAGCQGIIKTALACMKGSFHSQCHLRVLNGNIDDANFPALWPTEIGDLGLEYMHAGISSFGFGGTNVRTCIWSSVTKTVRNVADVAKPPELQGMVVARPSTLNIKKVDLDAIDVILTTCPRCLGRMCWSCGESEETISKTKHYCTQIRINLESYGICSSCYQGGFKAGQRPVTSVGNVSRTVYIIGSWSNWADFEKARQTEDGAYVHAVRLGSSRFEHFRLVLDKDSNQTFYPVKDKAAPRARIEGPSGNAKGRSWLIDGREGDVPHGTVYRIQFDWDYDKMSVGWEAVRMPEEMAALSKVVGQELISKLTQRRDGFSIAGSFANWVPKRMIQNESDDKLWETSFEIGRSGKAEFQVLFEENFAKAIYPVGTKVVDTSVQVRGPDAGGKGCHWLIVGARREVVNVQLRVSASDITLTTKSATGGERIWKSKVSHKPRYYITGTWTEWKWSESDDFELKADPLHPNTYRCQLTFRQPIEEFQISVDKDWSCMYHPARANNVRASSFVQGPDGEGHGCNWSLQGRIGSRASILLDLSSDTRGPSVSYDMCEHTADISTLPRMKSFE